MKLQISDGSTGQRTATYTVPEISMLSFQEWKDVAEVVVELSQLLHVVANLSSIDPVTDAPTSLATRVGFYLPTPLTAKVLERWAKQRLNGDSDPGGFPDSLDEVADQVLTPPLKVSTMLLAVAEEIAQNHLPNDAYCVTVSDE